jgi:hypothetical protein
MVKELVQTKGRFTLRGKITGMGNDRFPAFVEDTMTKGKNKGKLSRKLNIGIQTSPTNIIRVGTFDAMPDKVYMYSSEEKSGQMFDFDIWEEQKEYGYASLDVRVGFEFKEDGKVDSHTYPSFVASELIDDNFYNGDSVIAFGEITHSKGQTKDGNETVFTNYKLKGLIKIKDIDFDDEKFEEMSVFEEEIVYVDVVDDRKEKKMKVFGRTIDFKQDFVNVTYTIDYGTEDGLDKDMLRLAENFKKKLSFGDLVTVHGNIWNRLKVVQIEVKDDWGGKAQKTSDKREQSIDILGIADKEDGSKKIEKKMYSVQDFEVAQKKNEFVVDAPKSEQSLGGRENPFGGKNKKIDIEEDDFDSLPF